MATSSYDPEKLALDREKAAMSARAQEEELALKRADLQLRAQQAQNTMDNSMWSGDNALARSFGQQLVQQQNQIYGGNLALNLGNSISNTRYDPETLMEMSPGQRIALQFGQAFVGNALSSYGQRSAADAFKEQFFSQVQPFLSQLDPSDPLVPLLQNPQTAPFAVQAYVDRAKTQGANDAELQKAIALEKVKTEGQTTVEKIRAEAARASTQAAQRLKAMYDPDVAKQGFIVTDNGLERDPSRVAQVAPQGLGTGAVSGDFALSKWEQAYNKKIAEGASETTARIFADTFTKSDRDAMENLRKMAESDLTDGTELSRVGSSILQIGDSYQPGVLPTGVANLGRRFGAALGNDNATTSLEAQSIFDQVKPDILKASKSGISGAVSDKDMEVYLGSGPSANDTVEQRNLKASLMKEVGDRRRARGEFITQALQSGMSPHEVMPAWTAHIEKNPITQKSLDENGRTTVVVNPLPSIFGQSQESAAPAIDTTSGNRLQQLTKEQRYELYKQIKGQAAK